MVGLPEGLLLLLLFAFAGLFFVGLAFELLLDLAIDELGFEHVVLHPLDVLHLEIMQLVRDCFRVRYLPVVLRHQLLLHLLVKRLHLHLVQLFPLMLHTLLVLLLPLLNIFLDISLSEYIRH